MIMGIWWQWAVIGLITAVPTIWTLWRAAWPYVLDAIDDPSMFDLPPAVTVTFLAVGSVFIAFISIPFGPVLTVIMAVIWTMNRVIKNRRAYLKRKRSLGTSKSIPWKESA